MPRFTSFIRNQSSKAFAIALFLALCGGAAQYPGSPHRQDPDEPKKLPSGKSQSEEILKADHESNLKDLAQIRKLAEGIEEDLKKNDRHVLSLKALKDLDEIEKLSRKIRGRMRRF